MVIQRVKGASVKVDGRLISRIGPGLLALVGVMEGDTEADMAYSIGKLAGLRVFSDAEGKMNLSVQDIGGEVLLVSQFTLAGDVRHGKRPSFSRAAAPEIAQPMIEAMAGRMGEMGIPTLLGEFGAHMEVELNNDGPVTILLDSRKTF